MKAFSIHTATVAGLKNAAGTLLTNTDALCRVAVYDKDGATLLAPTAMTYSGTPGTWTYDIAAAIFTRASAPWDVQVQVFDAAGTTLYLTARSINPDSWRA